MWCYFCVIHKLPIEERLLLINLLTYSQFCNYAKEVQIEQEIRILAF